MFTSKRRPDSISSVSLTRVSSSRFRSRTNLPPWLVTFLLLLLLSVNILSACSINIPFIHNTTTLASPTSATMTLQQFLKQGRVDTKDHGSFYYPKLATPVLLTQHAQSAQTQPPSAEPARMKSIAVSLDNSFAAAHTTTPTAQTSKPLDLMGSDGRLEVLLPHDSLDFSHAVLTNGTAPSSGLTLQITQRYGHYSGERNILGSYQIQVVDSQAQVVHNVLLRQPVTIRYHYQPREMTDLDLDPGKLALSWPDLIVAARDAGQPTDNLAVPFSNDAATHTLTAQTMALGPGTVDISGDPQIQPPPKPLLASVSGNAGQLSYSYPLSMAPGPDGFAPQLQLSYSIESTNERYSQRSPASSVGEGWSLSLCSISAGNYPFGSTAGSGTWYFLSGVSNVSDRLIPAETPSFYETMHISHLRIQFSNNCFHIWDRSGYYYEAGCTSDSLQYATNSNGTRTNYRWDINKILAPYNSTSQIKTMYISYLQDKVILPRISGRVKSSDILFQKEEKGHAKGSKDLYNRV